MEENDPKRLDTHHHKNPTKFPKLCVTLGHQPQLYGAWTFRRNAGHTGVQKKILDVNIHRIISWSLFQKGKYQKCSCREKIVFLDIKFMQAACIRRYYILLAALERACFERWALCRWSSFSNHLFSDCSNLQWCWKGGTDNKSSKFHLSQCPCSQVAVFTKALFVSFYVLLWHLL